MDCTSSNLLYGMLRGVTLALCWCAVSPAVTGPNNLGTFNHNVFALLPEADLNFRFDVGPNLRAIVGYTFIYMNHVQRSGDAINTTLVSRSPQAFAFHESTFWLQGLNVGFEFRF